MAEPRSYEPTRSQPAARGLRRAVLIVMAAIGLVEIACFTYVRGPGDSDAFLDPARHTIDAEDVEKLRGIFDPVLGWKPRYDTPHGERPAEHVGAQDLIACFGGSYTHCGRVDDDETWEQRLADRLQGTVYNFGAIGYGPDQALLRFRMDYDEVRTPIVVLSFTSENINRVLNRYRKLYMPDTDIPCTKPRFILDGGELVLVDNPLHETDALSRLKDPVFIRGIAENDHWATPDDQPPWSFPYSRILLCSRFWSTMLRDRLARPYPVGRSTKEGPDLWQVAEHRDLMLAIFDQFAAEVRAAGARPVVVLLPREVEVMQRFNDGRHGEQVATIVSHMRDRGYPFYDGVEALAATARHPATIRSYFDEHLSPEGNLRLGSAFADFLVTSGVLADMDVRTVRAVQASAETEPATHGGDSADDACIWVDPVEPTASLIITTDKNGGLAVHDMRGERTQLLEDGRVNNVDLRDGFVLGGQETTLVVAGNRSEKRMVCYALDHGTHRLARVGETPVLDYEPVGSCLYKSAASGKLYAFVNNDDGLVEQFELLDDGEGKVVGRRVRRIQVNTPTERELRTSGYSAVEGCVADDEQGLFYIGQEDVALWVYRAEPGVDDEWRQRVASVGRSEILVPDIEGLALYLLPEGEGYLIVSNQGRDQFAVFDRRGGHEYLGSFEITAGGIDAVSHTDGIDVTSANLGPDYPCGVFVAQDDVNSRGNQNFKLVPWERIAAALGLRRSDE